MKNIKGKIGLMVASMPLMTYTCCTPILARIADTYPDAPLWLIQMLTTIGGLAVIVSALLVGRFTTRFTKRNIMLVSGLLYPISGMTIFFYHPNIYVIAFFTCTLGLASGVLSTCIPALICDCYDDKESAQLLGAEGGFISVGAMFFTWLGSQLARNRWENLYLIYGILTLLIIVEFICLPKGKIDAKKEKTEKKESIPPVVWFSAFMLLANALLIGVFMTNISMLVELRQLGSTVQSGYASSFYNFAGIFAGLITGMIITRSKLFTFPMGLLFGLCGMLCCFFGGHIAILCLGGALCGAAFNICTPAANFYASMKSSVYNRPLCIATVNSANSLGLVVSPLVFNALLQNVSTEARIENAFLIGAFGFVVFIIIALAICFFFRKKDL